jgi:protein SCO1/2
MSSKSNPRISLAVILGACLLPSIASSHIPIPPKEPSEIGRRVVKKTVADFQLSDQDSRPFKFTSTRGKLILVTFIFTTCPDVCPLLTAKLAAIQRTLEENKFRNYFLLSITTDPERDTAPALKQYARHFKADFHNWAFLTGSPQELAKVWKLFGINVTKNESGQVQHTSLTTLVDSQGNRRVDYFGDKWQEKQVLKDIEWLSSAMK